jgi:hypothetical protein
LPKADTVCSSWLREAHFIKRILPSPAAKT